VRVEYINPFISATVTTFDVMLNEKTKPEKPEVLKQSYGHQDISGIIGISGSATGSITLSFPKAVALKIVSKLLGTETKTIDADVTDAIGELANIVAGNAKQDMGNLEVSISLPNVVSGTDVSVSSPSSAMSIRIPFKSEFGNFFLIVSLKTPK
jgi:chemotaxis protein CheX